MGSTLGVVLPQHGPGSMENFLLKYPIIGNEIFDQLDSKNIAKCRRVTRSWYTFLAKERLVWIRKIEKYNANTRRLVNVAHGSGWHNS